jgi:hypothetical protein
MAVTACANDFFGIPILAEPKDDINAIIQNLIKGEHEKAGLHLKHLATTTPKFAQQIKLADFTIPCADCAVEKDPACGACNGKLSLIDPNALRYLQYKFDCAIEDDEPVEKAWADSWQAFDLRKKQVPNREVFQGQIAEICQDAFLMTGIDGETFYLMGCTTDGAEVGQPLVSYCWPMPGHPHSYKGRDGKPKTVKSYTLNLWWDY